MPPPSCAALLARAALRNSGTPGLVHSLDDAAEFWNTTDMSSRLRYTAAWLVFVAVLAVALRLGEFGDAAWQALALAIALGGLASLLSWLLGYVGRWCSGRD